MGNVFCGRVPADTCVEELRRERFRRGLGVYNRKTRTYEYSPEPYVRIKPLSKKNIPLKYSQYSDVKCLEYSILE